jgi:hypothetical protein
MGGVCGVVYDFQRKRMRSTGFEVVNQECRGHLFTLNLVQVHKV